MIYEMDELQEYIAENPDSLDRIFGDDDRVDWNFLNRVCCCLSVKGNPVERELAALERWCGKAEVLKKLAALGIIEIEENPGTLTAVEALRLEVRNIERAVWGRSRTTVRK